jgi:hypothetical protein
VISSLQPEIRLFSGYTTPPAALLKLKQLVPVLPMIVLL